MAKKAYEESNIAAIATEIREKTGGDKTYKVSQMNEGVNEVYEAGKKAEHEAFWDEFQSVDTFVGLFAGVGWNEKTFRPKTIRIDLKNANYCFYYNSFEGDLAEWCKELGIELLLKPTGLSNMFCYSRFTRIPEVDASQAGSLLNTFAYNENLVTIDKLILKNDGTNTFPSTFNNNISLQNIIFEGIIGQNINIRWSTKLTKASLTSFMEHLSTTAAFNVTMSREAVNNAFETSEGASDGSTSEEWLALVNARQNATIALVT